MYSTIHPASLKSISCVSDIILVGLQCSIKLTWAWSTGSLWAGKAASCEVTVSAEFWVQEQKVDLDITRGVFACWQLENEHGSVPAAQGVGKDVSWRWLKGQHSSSRDLRREHKEIGRQEMRTLLALVESLNLISVETSEGFCLLPVTTLQSTLSEERLEKEIREPGVVA